jgi:hypothetical protein
MKETQIYAGEAPTQHHSCRRFAPREQAIYLPEDAYRALKSGGGPEALTREQYLQFMHATFHAERWHARVQEGKENSDHEGMSHREIVIGIQRYRMSEAGSSKTFVRKRLREERRAVKEAFDIVDRMRAFEPGPLSESRLGRKQTQFHRRMTRKQIETFKQEHGNPFESR